MVSAPVLPALIALAVRILAWTWRVERAPWPVEGPCVLAFFHGEQLPMIALHRGMGIVGVTSLSRDGQLVADVLGRLGYDVVRGSSSRGGIEVIIRCRDAVRAGKRPALAVDGPRGPQFSVQPGAEALATRAAVPVVWGRVEAAGWRARSWDRFLLPWPFARVRVRYGVWHPGHGELGEAMVLPAVAAPVAAPVADRRS